MSVKASFALLLKKALLFSLPQLAFLAVWAAFFTQTGEFAEIKAVVSRAQNEAVYLYGPKYTNRAYQLKVQGAAAAKPEILAIGSSRMNQWRSAMFHPYSFYNGANAINVQKSYRRFIEDIGYPKPRVVIFTLDYFLLDDSWDSQYEHQTFEDDLKVGSPLYLKVLRALMDDVRSRPQELLVDQEPLYAAPAVGLSAAQGGNGFRIDGSYQYGRSIQKYQKEGQWSPDDDGSQERIKLGKAPFVFGEKPSEERLRELEEFAAYAKANGIALIGITMPFHSTAVQSMDVSPKHANWRSFNSSSMQEWIKQKGIIYFNFSHIESFGGRDEEFVDHFHASEPAYIRILLTMMKDPRTRELFKDISPQELERTLSKATPLEACFNSF